MNGAGEIVVNARWQVSGEALTEVLDLLDEVRAQSLAEPGCLAYEVFQAIDTPGSLLLVERYGDDAAVQAHRATPHYQELVVGRIVPLLASHEVELFRAQPSA